MSLKYIKQNKNFPHNDFTQLLLPMVRIIQKEYLSHTIAFLEGCIL